MREKILSFFSFVSDIVWNVFPSTPLAFLAYLGIITFLCLLIIFYLARKNKNKKKTATNKNKELTLEDLLKIANNPKSTTSDLLTALKLFNENFVVAQNKEKSFEFFEKILFHKNRHKKLFDYYHGSILPKNITFKDELDKLEKKALNK
ncbi:hypothetical protein C3L23_04560 [Nautilia sp. PV-1]|uniref:hypothetical protein n=1 Tax=Nautilia sp. PV-1 TaxID=2579250 RepID=UPI000FD6D68C|nr:hypothetical protein [Nautilia sp. PV-1]AZV46569.1 hypothetical protein C3L23_04560 [Nautilia sp. PV-1]